MKKSKFKSHEKLGITFQEYGALLGVKAMLEAGVLVYHPNTSDDTVRESSGHLFNMKVALEKNNHCGSIGCIGGSMALVMNDPSAIDKHGALSYVKCDRSAPLQPLFYPPDDYTWARINSKHALAAINNFFRTGKPMWNKVLGNVKAFNKKHLPYA